MTIGRRFWTVLLGAAAFLTGPGLAQTTGSQSQSTDPQDGLTVTGQKMPAAEAPRSATCEALAQDPYVRALFAAAKNDPFMGPRIFVPTRLPRNPDYGAPPKVAPGSPLPDLPKSRFGVRGLVLNGAEGGAISSAATDEGSAASGFDDTSIDGAIDACRQAYRRGGPPIGGGAQSSGFIPASSTLSESGAPHSSPEFRAGAATARFDQGRAFISANDTSLPMAFALFDQGRYVESLDWFRKASARLAMKEGGDEAALFIGKLYLQGLGAQSNPAEGLKWLKKAATAPFDPVLETPAFDPTQPERNTAVGEAAVILANVYRRGFGGIAANPAEARKWYDRARDVGHIPAAKVLGDLYYEGIGGPRDVKKAVAAYKQAAVLDYAPAQAALAAILHDGETGVPQDRAKALAWYHAAARYNHPGALYALARAYDLGEGVKADPQRAIGFYKSAALQGNPAAKVAMGTYFYEGKLVPRDMATARGWFEAGAAGGDADGMFNLAAMLANGEGGAKDKAGAWVLLRHAAALGHLAAPRALTALEARMTPEEKLAAGKILAARRAN